MKTTQTRTRKAIYSELAPARESKTQRQREEKENFIVEKKEAFRSIRRHREAGGRVCRKRASLVIAWGWGIFCFLQLALDWKLGQKLSTLSVINQVLSIWRHRLQGLWCGFLNWLLRTAVWLPWLVTVDNRFVSWDGCCRWWVRVQFSSLAWHICIFSFSWALRKHAGFEKMHEINRPEGDYGLMKKTSHYSVISWLLVPVLW